MTEVVEELIFLIPHSTGGNSRWSNICIPRNCFFLFYLFFARHFIQNSLFAIMVMYVADFFLLSLLLISCSAHNIPSMKWEQCYDTTWIFHTLPGKGVFFHFYMLLSVLWDSTREPFAGFSAELFTRTDSTKYLWTAASAAVPPLSTLPQNWGRDGCYWALKASKVKMKTQSTVFKIIEA